MQEITALLHRFPELSLFATIFFGTLIGRIHIKGLGLGSVVGSLVAGIVIGIFAKPEFPQLLRWIFFYLFLFSIGYSVGPRFFGSLRKEAIPTLRSRRRIDGISVGLLSGALTQSAALGTGLNAIAALPLSDEIKARLSGDAPLADAITYGFGDLGLILFITVFGPMMMRANLKSEATVLEAQLSSGGATASPLLAGSRFAFRGYRVENSSIAGITTFELEERYASGRLSVQRIKRGDKLISISPDTRIQHGDLLVIAAQRAVIANAEREIGSEFDDSDTLAVPIKSVSVVVTKRSVIGKTLAELAVDRQAVRGVYLESLKRGEEEMPRDMGVKLERGDVVRIVGSPQDVERVGKSVGYVEADMTKTDLTFVAAGIACGVLLGLITFNVNGVPLGLGTAGSILVVGLFAGLARSHYPVFGAIPEAAQRVLADIGLIVFSSFFASIFVGGMVVTMVPPLVGMVVGRWIFKMNPLMVLAGVSGAQTCTPALNALREASGSNIGALGYTVPYAIGNILLTIWGPVTVAIMHSLRS